MFITISRAMSVAVILSSVMFFIYFINHRKDELPRGTVRLPLYTIPVGAVCSTFFAVANFAQSFDEEYSPVYAALWGVFVILGLVLEIIPFTVRITYDTSGFTSRNAFMRSRTFSWRDVTAISTVRGDTKVYVGNKKVLVDEASEGVHEFLEYLDSQYSFYHGGSGVPEKQRGGRDIYNGNIRNPVLMTVLFLAPVLITSAIVIGLLVSDSAPKESELIETAVRFDECKADGSDLLLYVNDSESPFRIKEYADTFNTNAMLKNISEGESFNVTYDENDSYNDVYRMTGSDGTVYLNMNLAVKHEASRARHNAFIIGIFSALFAAFYLLMLTAARHPERFSARFIRLTWGSQFIGYHR